MVLDVVASAVVLEIVAGNTGQIQGVIKLSEGQQSGIRGDGGAVKFQADFFIVKPGWLRSNYSVTKGKGHIIRR